jgi:hypothetical protein
MSKEMGMRKKQVNSVSECYRSLVAAIVRQAIRDKAIWFLESPEVKSYCAAVGITKQVEETIRPVRVRDISHNAGRTGKGIHHGKTGFMFQG